MSGVEPVAMGDDDGRTLGQAYEAGVAARGAWEQPAPVPPNPYRLKRRHWIAWRSGWHDERMWKMQDTG